MRIFVLKSNTACLDNVNVKSPASSGRFDVVLDFVLECLFTRTGPRRDTVVYTVLDGCSPCRILEFSFATCQDRLEQEDQVLKLILERKVQIYEMSFEELLLKLRQEGYTLICLHENGVPISEVNIPCENVVFVIGDQDGFTQKDEEVLRRVGATFVSLGPIPYLSWFCCVYMHYYLDARCRG